MKKIVSILLAISMLLSVTSVFAAEPESTVLESTNIVNVTGKLTDGGESVNILLLDGGNVKYINEFPVEKDGSYRAKFKYEGEIKGLTLSVRQGEADVTASVVSAVSDKEAVVYTLDVVNSPVNTEIVAKIENHYNVTGKAYQVVVAYYDANNKLQNIIINDEIVEEGLNIFAEDFKIPDDAAKIKVFMWENAKTMIPLAESVEGKKNDTIRVLGIGNSLTTNAFAYLNEIAAADGADFTARKATIGGASFKTHYNAALNGSLSYGENGEACNIDHFLDDGSRYDYIVIQHEASFKASDEEIIENAKGLAKYIREKQPTAEIVVYQTWAYEKGSPIDHFVENYNGDQETMYLRIKNIIDDVCEELATVTTDSGLPISLDGKPLKYIPAGDAFQIARRSELFDTTYPGELFWDEKYLYWATTTIDESKIVSLNVDSQHASARFGRYLVGLLWYRCLSANPIDDNTYVNQYAPITAEGREIINAAIEEAIADSGIWD